MAVCIVAAWLLALAAHFLRQPLILAYLVAGFLIGPANLKLVEAEHSIQTISELGLILLLFMIGLEIDLKKIKGAGRLITLTATVQVLGGFALVLLAFWIFGDQFGLRKLEWIYLAVAISLSSTVIIVKLLYDKRELDTLPGRVTVGVTVLQDIFVILFLALQPQLGHLQFGPILFSMVKVATLVAVAFTASRYALPQIFRAVSRLPELVLVGALAWCFLISAIGEELGLSRAMGALVAGVSISTFPYTLDVAAKVTSLRDFFLTLFFVSLGMSIPPPKGDLAYGALFLCGLLVASRLVTVFVPLYKMRQGHRGSFLPALNLSQLSEFSLVILALGVKAGHVGPTASGMVTYAFVILAIISTYAIINSHVIFQKTSNLLGKIGLPDLDTPQADSPKPDKLRRIFILGFSWTASSLLEEITRHAPALLPELQVVDFNPRVFEELRRRGITTIYGDISQRGTLEQAGISRAEVILCTLPNTVLKGTNNVRLVQMLRELNPQAKIIVHSELFTDIPKLYAAGADYVCLSRLVEANEWFGLLRAAMGNLLEEKRAVQQEELKNRREVIP